LKKDYQPKKVLYYYSTKTHYYLKCKWSEFKIIKKAVSKHKSQYSSLQSKLIIAFYIKLSIIKHFLETGKFSESFREKKFDKNRNPLPPTKFENMSFRERIIYYLFSNLTIRGFVKFYNLSPREIGFKINYNNRDVLKLLDERYIYKYQINKEFKSQ